MNMLLQRLVLTVTAIWLGSAVKVMAQEVVPPASPVTDAAAPSPSVPAPANGNSGVSSAAPPVSAIAPPVGAGGDDSVKDAVKQALVGGIMATSDATGLDKKVLANGVQTVVSAVEGNALAAPERPRVPASYGVWKKSLFFTSAESSQLKSAIDIGDRVFATGGDPAALMDGDDEIARILAEEEEKNAKPIQIQYPSFFLRSVAFSSPKDWTVWVNNRLLSDEVPEDETGLKVVAISPEKVSFDWTPPAEFIKALKRLDMQAKLKQKAAASPQPSATNDPSLQTSAASTTAQPPTPAFDAPNRVAIDTPSGVFDKDAGVIHFTLKANQVFNAQNYKVFEGLPAAMPQVDPANVLGDQKVEAHGDGPAGKALGAVNGKFDKAVEDVIGSKRSPKAMMMNSLGKETPATSNSSATTPAGGAAAAPATPPPSGRIINDD